MQNGVDGSRTGGSETSTESDSGSRSVHVALVGEEDDIHDIIHGYLAEEGYEVTVRGPELVGSGESGRVPDLVVFNPKQSQIDEGDLPRQQVGDVTVPMLVVVSPLMTRAEGSVAGRGQIEWLVKPFDRDELVKKVEALLENASLGHRGQSRERNGASTGADAGADTGATRDADTVAAAGSEPNPEPTPDQTDTEPTPERADPSPVPEQTDAESTPDQPDEPGAGRAGDPDSSRTEAAPEVNADPDPAPANRHETAAIRNEVDEIRRRLAELSEDDAADIEEIETRVTALSADLSSLSDRVNTVDDRVEQLTGRTDEVDAEVDSNRDQIESLTEDVGENEAAVESLTEDVGGNEAAVESLTEDVEGNEAAVESLAEGIEALTDEQTRLAEEVDAVAGRQAELESTLEDLAAWREDVSAAFDSLVNPSE